MATRPLLIFPQPERSPRLKKPGGPSEIHFPAHRDQTRRLAPKFQGLQRAFEAERARLQLDPGRQVERVLVLEVIGQMDAFVKAVKRIQGMEWLGEWEEEGIESDEHFYIEGEPDKTLGGNLYLIMSNQQAMDELVRLWNRYRRNPREKFDHGLNKWRHIFAQLKDIRFWDERDRVSPALIRSWTEQLENYRDPLFLQVELWFSAREDKRNADQAFVEQLVREEGGRVVAQAVLTQIAFHAVAAEVPAIAARRIINLAQTRLLRCNEIMFFRPIGQSAVPYPGDQPAGALQRPRVGRPEGRDPVVALLDGLPLVNHQLLDGRIILDDPDGWSQDYQAADRIHGTLMASLISHGELEANEVPLATPIYARPILKPDRSAWRGAPVETIPEEIIAEDILHRAIIRIFSGEGATPPVAPSVKIISFAMGDPLRMFDRTPSPWARLVDWLSWEHRILFLISSGNQTGEIELNVPRGRLRHMTRQEIERATLLATETDGINRRLLSPAEAINALTIGAIHSDASPMGPLGNRVDPYISADLPSPVSALGLGYRRAVKPDILFPGGRQLFTERLGNAHQNEKLQVFPGTTRPPGQHAAAPGGAGDLTATRYYCGTSNATALAARRAAQLYEVLRTLREGPGGAALEERHTSVLLKTMLVHGSSWDGPAGVMEPVFQTLHNRPPFREYAPRFLGYGLCRYERMFSCPQERATLLGCGELRDGESHVYRIPLPPSLSGNLTWRRLTITLSWFTPIDSLDRFYRRAALWFVPPQEQLLVHRCQVESKMTQRGTVQHEVLEGEQATAFLDGQTMSVQVNCRAQSGHLDELIPYALAVTLEVAEGTAIPIYEEIRARLRVGVQVQPGNPNQ